MRYIILGFFTLLVTSNKFSKNLEDHLPKQLCHLHKHHAPKYSDMRNHQQAGKRKYMASK